MTGDLFSDMPFVGGYKSETEQVHPCYINQFGIYFGGSNQTDDDHDHDHDDDSPVNLPSQGTNWMSSCMEAKYRTYVTLQQMIEFAFIGGMTLFSMECDSFPLPSQMKEQMATVPSQNYFQPVSTKSATHRR